MKIDPSKKYKTTTGAQVIIHAVNGPDPQHPIIASVRSGVVDDWRLAYWDESDLVEVREPREFKLAINREDTRLVYSRGVESLDEKDWEIVRVREIIEP